MKTKWILALGVAAALGPAAAMAQNTPINQPHEGGGNNVGSCGWGSYLFQGRRGILPQVFAITTNTSLGNQTLGITTGTSGCTQNGVVHSNWQMSMLIDGNRHLLAQDTANGGGEMLASVASLAGVAPQDRDAFYRVLQAHFTTIFPAPSVSTAQIHTALHDVVAQDPELAKYSKNI